jgi:hypothetical protein
VCPMHTNLHHTDTKAMRICIYKRWLEEQVTGSALSGRKMRKYA